MSYMGAKNGSGVFQAIIALMPPHDTYVEPFVGSGAILQRKAPAARSIAIDKDPAATARIRWLGWRGELGPVHQVEVLELDALEWLARLDPAKLGRLLIYADPPYLLCTRSSRHRYANEFTDDDHRRLAIVLQVLAGKGCAVIVSGYPSTLYDGLYDGWNTRELQAMTRGGVRTEKLWFNFEPGAAHWSTFAGKNFTDRQRIKRKAARWAAMFRAMPPAERQAVLAALLALADPA